MVTNTDDRFQWAVRIGYFSRGIVYALVGIFAFMAAFWGGGQAEGQKGALTSLLSQPYGQWLLGFIGIGLLAHALWRLLEGAKDLDRHGSDAKGLGIRAGLILSAITNSILAVYCLNLIFHFSSSSGGGNGKEEWTAWLLSQPYGTFMVGVIALGFLVAAGAQIAKVVKESYKKYLKVDQQQLKWIGPISKIGLISRAVVFAIIAYFFVVAAWYSNANQAGGLGEALRWVQNQAYGTWLLAVLALGLLAFALYSMIQAVYRQVPGRHQAT